MIAHFPEVKNNYLCIKKDMLGKTAQYYRDNPEARNKKKAYDTKRNKTAASKLYRARLNKANRDNPNSVVGDGKDVSHTKKGLRLKPQSKNRGSKSDSAGDKRARG